MILCDVYRSSKKPDIYLYVAKSDGLSRVPEELLGTFGTPEHVILFKLTPERKLAKEDTQKVIQNLVEQGYHLQLPPVIKPRASLTSS
ncbi:MAG: YcgL domain-containing protein [Gammaproteobacteria bacterium]|nr:YcgL domain-containing protein [Gammaproteobacteria bacterium]